MQKSWCASFEGRSVPRFFFFLLACFVPLLVFLLSIFTVFLASSFSCIPSFFRFTISTFFFLDESAKVTGQDVRAISSRELPPSFSPNSLHPSSPGIPRTTIEMPSPTPSRKSSSSSSSASTFNERSALLDSAQSPSQWGALVGVEVAGAIPEDDEREEHHHGRELGEEEEGRIYGWRLAITL